LDGGRRGVLSIPTYLLTEVGRRWTRDVDTGVVGAVGTGAGGGRGRGQDAVGGRTFDLLIRV
jgi:hypothetical protein